jgi:mannosyltransferase OCH1-like enzyme
VDQWRWLADKFDEFESRPAVAPEIGIPRLIHQIWIGGKLPASYQTWTKSWTTLNKGWQYRLWNARDILALGLKNEEAFRRSWSVGAKSDIARYEILERLGGVYADTDFECLRPIEEISRRCSFFVALIFGESPVVSNGLIGARPGHPLLQEAVRRLGSPVLTKDGMEVLNLTGPGFWSNLLFEKRQLLDDSGTILPSSYFFPVPNYVDRNAPAEKKRAMIRPWSAAVHQWETAWLKPPGWKRALVVLRDRVLGKVRK